MEAFYGHYFCRNSRGFLCAIMAACKPCGKTCRLSFFLQYTEVEIIMDTLYWITGIIAVSLLVYLVIALLKPEIFS
jgi:K+-transporting ATPase KdpF subunit